MSFFEFLEDCLAIIDRRLAQRFRVIERRLISSNLREQDAWMLRLQQNNWDLYTLSQREEYLKGEVEPLRLKRVFLTPVEAWKLEQLEWELAGIDARWNQSVREQEEIWGARVNGPSTRHAEASWADRKMFFGQSREICVARDGCCSRACGCCERVRDETRIKTKQHCTDACGCCTRHRGFYKP